ncbi:MAG TPA: ACP S-malonyltransferase [Devosia sp.]|nr:ACP S-malonyltransferase [Devosia sp.]
MAKRAFTFPGQGSQAVGMGRELSEKYQEARNVFIEVDDALGYNLTAIMFDGPEDTLRLTENAQPALMAVSMAVIRVLEARGVKLADHAAYVAGHSLGEYTALAAAGSLSLADAARLLQTRGRAMQKAVPVGQGAMAAILGIDFEALRDIAGAAALDQVCDIANDNAPGQIVISGSKDAVERAMELAKARGAKRALPLPVSAPFHSRLMAPAAEVMREALRDVTLKAPVVPLVSNVLARPITEPDEIRRRLVEQVTGMVRWTESVQWLTGEGGVTNLVELGSGKVLSGLAKRIAPDVPAVSLGAPADIDAFVKDLTA